MRIHLVLIPLCATVAFGAINVPLDVSNWADIARTGEPVTAGVPLPQGAVYDLSKLRITDNSGTTVPAQFKALSKWWREKSLGVQDPSVKWVLCDFQAGVPAANKTSFTLKDDNGSSVSSTTLSLTQDASLVTVVTGPLKFTVSKTHFNLFDGVWLDANANGQFEAGEQIVASNAQNGGVITSGDWSAQGCVNGTPHYSSQKAPERVVIEEQGPMKIVIRVEGRHYAASGGATKGLYGYQVFITAYAGKPYVDVQWAVTNTYMEGDKPELGATPWTAYVWPFTGYNLDLNLNLGGAQTYALLGQTEATGSLSASAVRLLQSQGSYTLTNASGGTDARGAASVSNGTLGVRVAMRDFAPNNPKGISLVKDKISLELFPSATTPYCLDPFSRKNHRMRFEFFGGAPASGALLNLAKQVDAPLRLLAPREWYRFTNAWERGFGVPPSNEWNRTAPSAWTRMAKTSAGVDWIKYGELDEFNGGGDHWNLTSCYWWYMLTGNPVDFENAEKQTLNFNDIVPIHSSSNRWTDLAYWALPESHLSGLSDIHSTAETGFQAVIQSYTGSYTWHRSDIPDAGHMPNKQELEYYLLTGDPATKDAVESEGIRAVCTIFYRAYGPYGGWPYSVGQGRKVDLDSFYVMPYGPRYIARPGLVACHAYEVTGDDRYLYPARIASYSLRNYIKRNPIGYMAEANDALYADTAKSFAVWQAAHPGVAIPCFFSGSDFQIGIGTQALYNFWEESGDEEIRDAVISSAKSYEWRLGFTGGKYTGFTYSGWADFLDDGKRYTDVGITPSFTSSASEGFGGLIFGYLASGRSELWNVIADGLSGVYAGGANGYDVNCFSPSGNCKELKLINLWQAKWKHDSLDITPPAAVSDLSATVVPGSGVQLTWTAPGDDGNTGRASEYQVKFAKGPIVDFASRWNAATQTGWPDLRSPLPMSDTALFARCAQYKLRETAFWGADNAKNEPAPKPAGQKESMLLSGLEPGTRYYFALVSFDKAGNASALSNSANLTTGIYRGTGNSSSRFGLLGARVMPFNRSVRISYSVAPDPKPFTIAIYDMRGRFVQRLFSGVEKPGLHEKIWDCGTAGSGLYMVRLLAPGTSRIVKMALSR